MSTIRSSIKSRVRDWVDFDLTQKAQDTTKYTFHDSSMELAQGLDVKDFSEADTIPAELLDFFDKK